MSGGPCTGLGEHQQTEQGWHCSQLCPNALVAEPHPSCSASIEADRVILNLLSKIHSTAPFILSASFFFPSPPWVYFLFSLLKAIRWSSSSSQESIQFIRTPFCFHPFFCNQCKSRSGFHLGQCCSQARLVSSQMLSTHNTGQGEGCR